MKASLTFAGLMISALSWAQVYIEHNIPKVLGAGNEREVDIVIHRPAIKGFSQYEVSFQPGIAFSGRNTGGGTFRGEDNKVRIIWSITPAGQLRLRFAIMPATSGSYVIRQRYEYEQAGERKVAYIADLPLEVRDGFVSTGSEPFSRLDQVVPKELPISRVDSLEQKLKDPAKAGEHAAQLRRDAAEARKVGQNELKEAELEIIEAKKALEQASRNKDEQVRAGLVKEAEERITKAETNKQVAQKIMILANTLEQNAADIEKAGLAASNDTALGTKEKKSEEEIAQLKKIFESNNGTPSADAAANGTAVPLYHIQIGAFGQPPVKSNYRKAGKISVVNENGLYKVLVGGFEKREDAEKKRQELSVSGFDGFIVRYQGDQRIK